ncbi:MAG: response regulator [Bacteroidota bacterium]
MSKKFKSILLIDDNAADNRYNQIILEEMNIVDDIKIAESGLEALKILDTNDNAQPELILLDINMPKMNGWEFLEAYKKLHVDEDDKKIVVVLTTSMNPEDKKKAGEISGVSEFNIKPLTPEMLEKIIEKYSLGSKE